MKKPTIRIAISFIVLLLLGCADKKDVSPDKVPTDNPLATGLDKSLHGNFEAFMKSNKWPGLSIAVIKGENTYFYNYGKNELGEVPSSQSLYEIASITKTFTATVVAALLQEESISINTPINLLLPGDYSHLQFEDQPITVLHLLNHTSGLPRVPDDIFDNGSDQNAYENYSYENMLEYLNDFELPRKPGTVYEYSNFGFALLALIMEDQTGNSISQLIEEVITNPLGMTATNMELNKLNELQPGQIMKPHNPNGRETYFWTWGDWAGMGGLHSNMDDMVKYARAQFDSFSGEYSSAYKETKIETFDTGQLSIGLSWHLLPEEGKVVYNHNGGSSGFTSCILIEPEDGIAVIALTNMLDEELFVPSINTMRYIMQNIEN